MTKHIGFSAIRGLGNDPKDFIPDLFRFMDRYDCDFYLEKSYGEALEYFNEHLR